MVAKKKTSNSPAVDSGSHESLISACAHEPAAEWVAIDAIRTWQKNPRKNDAAVVKVIESIRRFGFGSPILARKADGEIIAGHTRYAAAVHLGMPTVPVRYMDLDPADAHLLALADNKLGEIAEWDDPALVSILSEYGLEDAEVAGWDRKDLDELANGIGAEDEPDTSSQLEGMIYQVVVECRDEDHQTELLSEFEAKGLKCRPLMS